MARFVGTMIVIAIALAVIVPLITKLVNVLLVPVGIGVVLYLAVRLVNAHLNRW